MTSPYSVDESALIVRLTRYITRLKKLCHFLSQSVVRNRESLSCLKFEGKLFGFLVFYGPDLLDR